MSSGGGSGATSGAMSGAASGAAYGPWGAAIGGGMGLIMGAQQDAATAARQAWEQEQAKTNAMFMEIQKNEILEQGRDQAAQREEAVRGMLGRQRVDLAAQGIQIDSGTAAAIQAETRQIGDEDIAAIKNNAWKQVWGIEIERKNMLQDVSMRHRGERQQAQTQMLTDGLSAVGTGYGNYKSW